MPKITLKYSDESAIPSDLKQYKTDANTVEVWVGTDQMAVAAELNPAIATNRDAILQEKKDVQAKYDTLLASSAETSREVLELRNKVANGSAMSADEVAIVQTVKGVLPTIKAPDLKTMLEKVPSMESELTSIKSRETNRAVFAASGFKNEKVFLDLIGNADKNPNLDGVEVREVEENGTKSNKVFVKVKLEGNKITEKSLADYIKENAEWTDYLPALTNGVENKQTDWITQPLSDKSKEGGNKSPLDEFIANQNKQAQERPNALLGNSQQKASAT